jgi:hypothetical protein
MIPKYQLVDENIKKALAKIDESLPKLTKAQKEEIAESS